MLIIAVILINLALIFYTVGVWWEHRNGSLRVSHVIAFSLGFLCDTGGTTAMSLLSEHNSLLSFHGVTGLIAILLMLFHLLWAIRVLVKKDEKTKRTFHKFSLLVWGIWLVPYLSGAVFGML